MGLEAHAKGLAPAYYLQKEQLLASLNVEFLYITLKHTRRAEPLQAHTEISSRTWIQTCRPRNRPMHLSLKSGFSETPWCL